MKLNISIEKLLSVFLVSLSAGVVFAQAQPQTATQAQDQTAAQASMPKNDAQIAEIMRIANEGEIEAAKVAQSKAANPQVKNFAKTMIDEHTKNMKDQKELAKKEKMTPEPNDVAKTLQTDSKTKMEDLKKAKGAEFDKTYINQQVATHQKLNDDLTQRFIPAAKDPQFKQFLQTTQTHVEHHLAQAREIQAAMTK